MLNELFVKLLDRSLTASLAVAAVWLTRRLLLRRAPRAFAYALWAAVLLPLLLPASGLPLGLLPQSEFFQGRYARSLAPVAVLYESSPGGSAPVLYTLQRSGLAKMISRCAVLWLLGLGVMAGGGLFSLLRLRKRLAEAVPLRDNIVLSDQVDGPFVLGLLRPRIVLPLGLTAEQRELIILHEQLHIRRCDHILRLLAYAALCLHWFNPLIWLACALLERDMEVSCDEAVLRGKDGETRAVYAETLLRFSARHWYAAPPAFAESGVRERVERIMCFRDIPKAAAALALCVCLAVSVLLLPGARQQERWVEPSLRLDEVSYIETAVEISPDAAEADAWVEAPVWEEADDISPALYESSHSEAPEAVEVTVLRRLFGWESASARIPEARQDAAVPGLG